MIAFRTDATLPGCGECQQWARELINLRHGEPRPDLYCSTANEATVYRAVVARVKATA